MRGRKREIAEHLIEVELPKGSHCSFWSQEVLDYACYLESRADVLNYQSPPSLSLNRYQIRSLGDLPDFQIEYRTGPRCLVDVLNNQNKNRRSGDEALAWREFCKERDLVYRQIDAEEVNEHEMHCRNWFDLTRWLIQFPEAALCDRQMRSVEKHLKLANGALTFGSVIHFFDTCAPDVITAILIRLIHKGRAEAPLHAKRFTLDMPIMVKQ